MSSLYLLQSNGTVEACNKILEYGLTKVCLANWVDWDEQIPTILRAYRTTTKRLNNHTPF
jgi:hypothetical protein